LLSALAVNAHTADAMAIGGWLADAATQAVLRLCLHEMKLPVGFPFVALAMSKHGSREMGLVSDLDMVSMLAYDDPRNILGQRRHGSIRHYAGGLVDIEFLAQFARLTFATDARRVVDIFQQLPEDTPDAWHLQTDFLAETYLDFRQMENALRVELCRPIGALPNDPAASEWETMRRHASVTTPVAPHARMQMVRSLFNDLLGAD